MSDSPQINSQIPQPRHQRYRPDIDGLRAIAVLSVVAFHAFPDWMKGGFIGVDIFFVISGFLISTIIFEGLDKETFSFSDFYARRIKRIFPALLLVLSACLAIGWAALFADEYKQLGKHIFSGASFASNFTLWGEAGYFDNSAESKPLLHLWSLGIEEQFYIVWPLLLWLAWKRKFSPALIISTLAVISLYLNLRGVSKDAVATFYSPQTRFWELLSGSLLAWATLYKGDFFNTIKVKTGRILEVAIPGIQVNSGERQLSNLLSLVGLSLLVYGFWRIDSGIGFPGKWAIIPVLATVLIICAGPQTIINRLVLSNPVLVWLGLISFPLYLWHWPLLSFLWIIEAGNPSYKALLIVLVLSVLLSWLTYRLVERPVRLGRWRKHVPSTLVFLMLVVGALGGLTYKKDGFGDRVAANGVKFSEYSDLLAINLGLGDSCVYDKDFKTDKCKFGDSPTVLLWGDSYAMHLVQALESSKDVYSFRQHTASSCRPILDMNYYDNGPDGDNLVKNCLRQNELVYKWLSENRQITHVILSSPYNLKSDIFVEGKVVKGGYDTQARYMELTIDKLRALGVKPIVVAPTPWSGYDMGRCWARRSLVRAEASCDFLYKNSNEMTFDISQFMQKVETFAPVFHLQDLTCVDGVCSTHINGFPLHRDKGHLSMSGSAELGKKFNLTKMLIDRADSYWDNQ
ncbi:acyltransferase [Pseudomonas chlororaphis subsp. chlororaphis]|uniref:acyltransferase family protein n=1 Tax=Pseudomonas chlororaphis TaxID=587753 RepID=UPI0011B6C978|nr:acyltransferase family protein [Pseudomonas chlororaphis]TWR99048.1 acyltransferase [Pseudomonas chlororaphis subsp. chlororaphis]